MSAVEFYDWTTNPKEYLRVYKAQMYLQDVDIAAYCRYFLATLKNVTKSWLNGFIPGSVSCFQDLADQFISQFIVCRKETQTNIPLSKIK